MTTTYANRKERAAQWALNGWQKIAIDSRGHLYPCRQPCPGHKSADIRGQSGKSFSVEALRLIEEARE